MDFENVRTNLQEAEDWITDQPDCIAPNEFQGAMDWAMDQLGMDCGASGAVALVLGASTLFAGSIAI